MVPKTRALPAQVEVAVPSLIACGGLAVTWCGITSLAALTGRWVGTRGDQGAPPRLCARTALGFGAACGWPAFPQRVAWAV